MTKSGNDDLHDKLSALFQGSTLDTRLADALIGTAYGEQPSAMDLLLKHAGKVKDWQDALKSPADVIKLFKDEMEAQDDGHALRKWDKLTARILEIYKDIPEQLAAEKDRVFALLEVLAAKSPAGANLARSSIMQMRDEGDARAVAKMNRMRGIDPQGGPKSSHYKPDDNPDRKAVIARALGMM